MNPDIHGPLVKGKTRKQIKARRDRAEARVKKSVRQLCVDRDGYCRLSSEAWENHPDDWHDDALNDTCDGPAQWAHLHSHRRSQTRGQTATRRHTTFGSLMLCVEHHQQYDAHQLQILIVGNDGCDGSLEFRARHAS